MAKTDLTADRLRELLHYDHDTGVFTWSIKPSRNRLVGSVAGHVCKVHGYRFIRIDHVSHRAHALAWLYVTGAWPVDLLDHINGSRSDNRFANLREATAKQNAENRRIGISNTTGFRGVSFHKRTGKFRATIGHNGRRFHIGLFSTAEQAAEFAQMKRREVFTHNTLEDA